MHPIFVFFCPTSYRTAPYHQTGNLPKTTQGERLDQTFFSIRMFVTSQTLFDIVLLINNGSLSREIHLRPSLPFFLFLVYDESEEDEDYH